MSQEQLAEDLAYVRAVAEEGRQTPLIGGAQLILSGSLLTVAYLLHWATITGALDWAPFGFGVIWGGFGLAMWIGMALLKPRARAASGAASNANRVHRVVWQGAALAIGAVIVGGMRTGDPVVMNAIMAAAFGLYGVALGSTGIIAGQAWLRWFSYLALAASAALWMFGDETWAYLLAAVCAVLVLIAPGALMLRRKAAA